MTFLVFYLQVLYFWFDFLYLGIIIMFFRYIMFNFIFIMNFLAKLSNRWDYFDYHHQEIYESAKQKERQTYHTAVND